MKTVPKEDLLSRTVERVDQKYHEQFVHETHEYLRKRQEAKQRRDSESVNTEQTRQAAEVPT